MKCRWPYLFVLFLCHFYTKVLASALKVQVKESNPEFGREKLGKLMSALLSITRAWPLVAGCRTLPKRYQRGGRSMQR